MITYLIHLWMIGHLKINKKIDLQSNKFVGIVDDSKTIHKELTAMSQ